jgi:beta-ureidopropionase / N-carbamoyl-L-amino-acid hydrolase
MNTYTHTHHLDLNQLNQASLAQWLSALDGVYEHSPWIAERAAAHRPWPSLAALKHGLQRILHEATPDEQLGLIRAHPELAGKAALAGQLSKESTGEQAGVGLHLCSAEEYAQLQQLNSDYKAKFGFPFIVAVKGPDGQGLSRQQIIANFSRRLNASVASETAEALHQIGRIAEMRLNALFGVSLQFGEEIMRRVQHLASYSEQSDGLYCSYLHSAHQQCAAQIAQWMKQAGLAVQIDAVGNVRGRYLCSQADAKTLIIGSHYDTVNNAGWFDGRLGIVLPMLVLQHLQQLRELGQDSGQDSGFPFHIELVAFSEEEGVRFPCTFLGSRALAGRFDAALLQLNDGNGVSLQQALLQAGHEPGEIADLALSPDQVCGFLEVHIEQGPILLQQHLPLGVVTAIAGSSRFWLHISGEANHAGTTPMDMRHDAVAAGAEIILAIEARCRSEAGLVGTVGQVQIPAAATNVVAGACSISVDVRAPNDAQRLAAVADIMQTVQEICQRRAVQWRKQSMVQVAAAPCDPGLQQALHQALRQCGVPEFSLPSGAGHDAMMMANLTPMAMLFVRCGNRGISHNPLETMTADDAELAAQVLMEWLNQIKRTS